MTLADRISLIMPDGLDWMLQADLQGFWKPEPKDEDEEAMTADELSAEYGLKPGVDYPWSLRR